MSTPQTPHLLRHMPSVQLALFVSDPISGRLDCLLRAADQAGERTSRRELLAALILNQPLTGQGLAALLDAHGSARVRDAFVEGQPHELVTRPSHAPGPRQLSLFPGQPPPKPPRPYEGDQELAELPTDRIGVSVPQPIRDRLEALVDAADWAEDRDEIVAALILAAPANGERLSHLVHRYRMTPAPQGERTTVEKDRRRGRRLREGGRRRRRYRRD